MFPKTGLLSGSQRDTPLYLGSFHFGSSVDHWWRNPTNSSKKQYRQHVSQRSEPVVSQSRPLHSWPMRLGRICRVSFASAGNNESLTKKIKCLSAFALTATHFTLLLYSNWHPFISIIRSRLHRSCLQPVGERAACVSSRTCVILRSPHKGRKQLSIPKMQFQMTDLWLLNKTP